jgi:hypothetical protein
VLVDGAARRRRPNQPPVSAQATSRDRATIRITFVHADADAIDDRTEWHRQADPTPAGFRVPRAQPLDLAA